MKKQPLTQSQAGITLLRWIFSVLLVLSSSLCIATADDDPRVTLQLTNSANVSYANIGTQIVYTLKYTCASTTASGKKVEIRETLDPHMKVTGLTGSSHIATSDYDPATNEVAFDFIHPLPAGSTGELKIYAEFKPGVADDYVAPNQATMDANNADLVTSNNVDVRAEIDTSTTVSYSKGVSIFKYSSLDELSLPYNRTYFYIKHGNTGAAGQDVDNYVIEDILPANLQMDYFRVGKFPGTSGTVNVRYQTNLGGGAWKDWVANYSTDGPNDSQYKYLVGLPDGEYITAVRFEFGTLPGGAGFHPDASGVVPITIGTRLADPSASTAGDKINNCASVTGADGADNYDETSCKEITVTPPEADFFVWDWDETLASPYVHGDVMRMASSVGVTWKSGLGMTNPVVSHLLPIGFSYQGNEWVGGDAYLDAGSPGYTLDVVDDFAGSARQMVRFTFPSVSIPATGSDLPIYMTFDMRVEPSAYFGTRESEVYGSWDTPLDNIGTGWRVVDTLDYNGNGNSSENIAKDTATWIVGETGSGVASIDSVKGVKGELDSSYSSYPDTGLTVPGGRADYQLSITNSGGVALRDLVVIEILPHIGDRGVIDLEERGSEWNPFLVGAVAAPDGYSVFYSNSGNPCRDELTPGLPSGCEDAAWSSSLPADPSEVKALKFVQNENVWLPAGSSVTIAWPMRAPINAPTGGEVAWSSFGVVGARADNNQRLLASEPGKVGIAIQPNLPPFYGDTVWFDGNRNGVQDNGESGINGVRVELYEDNGDGVADPAVDSLYSFTLTSNDGTDDGRYLFSYIPAGDYFSVFYTPDGHVITPANNAGDDLLDSDGTGQTVGGQPAAVTAITSIGSGEEDHSWDQGFYDRSALPAVWAIASLGSDSVVIGGKFQSSHGVPCGNIAVLGANGSPSGSFQSGTGFNGIVRALAVTDDGKILAGGEFTEYDGYPANGLALINGDGSWVSGLAMPDVNDVRWVGASGGSFYIAGGFTSLGGQPAPCIGKLTSSGNFDPSFAPGEGADGPIHCAAVSGSGVIIGGSFSSYQGNDAAGLTKLKADGSFDQSFNIGTGFDGPVNSITIKGDSLFAVGDFSTCNDHAANGAARLNMNGQVDTSFEESGLSVNSNRASN